MSQKYDELIEKLRSLDIHNIQIQPRLYRGRSADEQAWIQAQQNFKDAQGHIQCITISKSNLDDVISCAEYFKNVNGTVTQLAE